MKTYRSTLAKVILEKDPAARSMFLAKYFYPSTRALVAHKRAHKLYNKGYYNIASFISLRARRKTGIEIHPGAIIGKNLFIDHGMSVVIGETAVIGDDVLIYHGVTLGGVGQGANEKRHPNIEDGVIIGANATILGPITVGKHAKVGANSVVLQNVPNAFTAVGSPAKLIAPK